MRIKVNKRIEPDQLTEELLPLGINSIEYDEKTKEIIVLDSFGVSESDVKSKVASHTAVIPKTRIEKLQALKASNTLPDFKQALLDLYGVK